MDIWVVSILCLLLTILLRAYIYKILCVHMFSFLLGMYLETRLLDMVTLWLTFWGTIRLFSKVAVLFYTPPAMCESLSTLILPVFLIIAILEDLRWYLTMVLFCISVMTNDVEKFSSAYQFNIFLLNQCLHFKTFMFINTYEKYIKANILLNIT